jgi:COP9 signalosome complex subunit 7
MLTHGSLQSRPTLLVTRLLSATIASPDSVRSRAPLIYPGPCTFDRGGWRQYGSMASLEAALQLAKSQSGLGLTAVVQRVLRAKDTFVFSELLDLPQVQALERDPAHKPTFDLLTLFVGGSYADLKARRAELPGVDALLDGPLLEKLKLLSLVGLASSRKVIPYDDLQAALDLATDSDVEGVVIAAVYSGLLHARLDQRARTVEVSHCAGRDVRGADGAYLQDLLAKLTAWCVGGGGGGKGST